MNNIELAVKIDKISIQIKEKEKNESYEILNEYCKTMSKIFYDLVTESLNKPIETIIVKNNLPKFRIKPTYANLSFCINFEKDPINEMKKIGISVDDCKSFCNEGFVEFHRKYKYIKIAYPE
jgi:hypothetical protein